MLSGFTAASATPAAPDVAVPSTAYAIEVRKMPSSSFDPDPRPLSSCRSSRGVLQHVGPGLTPEHGDELAGAYSVGDDGVLDVSELPDDAFALAR